MFKRYGPFFLFVFSVSLFLDNPERQKTTEEVFGSSVRVRRQESGAKRSLSGVPSSSSVGTKTSDSAVPGSVSQSTAEGVLCHFLSLGFVLFMLVNMNRWCTQQHPKGYAKWYRSPNGFFVHTVICRLHCESLPDVPPWWTNELCCFTVP